MIGDHETIQVDAEKPQLTEIEREKLLFLMGTYAYSIPTFEWEELAKHLEKFAVDVAARHQADQAQHAAESAPAEIHVATESKNRRLRRKRPMPEWEA